MNINTIIFDLDGTLLPMSSETFEGAYFKSLVQYLSPYVSQDVLMNAIWNALKDTVTNNDYITNEKVFFESFKKYFKGESDVSVILDAFYRYYDEAFDDLAALVPNNQAFVKAVLSLKDKGYTLLIATNPLFPKAAIYKRIEWAGFRVDDFSYISTFEASHYCKPNLNYYREILERNNLDPASCLMIGNDVQEDMIACELGMKGWILTDYVIDREKEMEYHWKGTRQDFIEKIKTEL